MTLGGNLAFHRPRGHRSNTPNRENLAWDHPVREFPSALFLGHITHMFSRNKELVKGRERGLGRGARAWGDIA